MVEPFQNSREHLHAELACLDLIIQREVWRWRQINAPDPQGGDEFRGLYVSEAEIDAILNGVYPGSERVAREASGQDVERAFGEAIERASGEIMLRKAAAGERGISLWLERLRETFDLTPFDMSALLIALAPEIDLRYERLYAYLQDDVTRKRPSVSLVLNLLCATPDDQLDARSRFWADAPLLRYQLVALLQDPANTSPPLLAHYIKPDPRIAEYLLAGEQQHSLDERLRDLCDVQHPDIGLDGLLLPEEVQAELAHLTFQSRDGARSKGQQRCTLIILQGERGTGKFQAAQAACTAWRQPLLLVHLQRLLAQERHFADLARRVAREAYLTGAALYWRGYDALIAEHHDGSTDPARHRETLHAILSDLPVISFLPLEDVERQADRTLLRAPRLVRIRFPYPAYPLRRALWDNTLAPYGPLPQVNVTDVAGRFRLTEGQIAEAVLDAHHRADQRPSDRREITADDLFAAARARTSEQLRGQAKKVEPRHDWEDLVLPEDQVAQLHELCDQLKYRHIVLGEWGFDNKMSTGKGLNALFAGPSGTGKTMAAEVIAGELGLDLYKIDLSTVMSKYVGETEKNLERIFCAARNSNAILFFDEADALFGKRSEVRDAHDRYANVEISYLLQRMEEYEGLVILTSNLSQNMDEAFVRRMHFTVEFPYPESDARRHIWQIVFPQETPLTPQVDLNLLAERYRLTGGNIRNVALTAAFLAARDGGVVCMHHLLWAARREYQKMGRLADEHEFVME